MLRDSLRAIRRALIRKSVWTALRRIVRYKLVEGPLTYNQDRLATRHSADFMHDPLFDQAYRMGCETGSWGCAKIHWRAHVACWAASVAVRLPGDFVECGVNRGGLSRTVMHYVGFARLPKTFWLLDTFEGIPEESLTAEERRLGRKGGRYKDCYLEVLRTFREMPNVEVVRGVVPGTLEKVRSQQVAYLSLDMNVAEPEIAAAEFFWDRMASGALILLDDYGWSGHETQRIAFNAFARAHGVTVLSLPTGQGLIVKPPS